MRVVGMLSVKVRSNTITPSESGWHVSVKVRSNTITPSESGWHVECQGEV